MKAARDWHRFVGIAGALFFLLLAATGLTLVHVDDLALSKRYVTAGWLLDLYGISPPAPTTGFSVGGRHVVAMDTSLYLDDRHIGSSTPPTGVLQLGDRLFVAQSDYLLVYDLAGDLVEKVPAPSPIHALGSFDGGLVAQTPGGLSAINEDALAFEALRLDSSDTDIEWSQPAALPDALARRVLEVHRGRILSFERVMLDLHSGRIFGAWGLWFFDLIAIALALLAITGIVLWAQRAPPTPP